VEVEAEIVTTHGAKQLADVGGEARLVIFTVNQLFTISRFTR
jgi:hypothetical protein